MVRRQNMSGRKVPLWTTVHRHPLNVKPQGNAFLSLEETDEMKNVPREKQMGHFSAFPDELLMEILGYIDDVESMKNLSHTSRVMYAYLYDEELWRKLYISKIDEVNLDTIKFKWRGSWRSSLLGIEYDDQANVQISGNLLCSDVLYRPYQCSQIDYNRLFQKIIKEEEAYKNETRQDTYDYKEKLVSLSAGKILRIPEALLGLDEFSSKFHDKPFILFNTDPERWPTWSFEQLNERFGEVSFRQEAVRWPLAVYLDYLTRNHDESPLYLFDCSSDAMGTLRKEFEVPEVFQDDFFKAFEVPNIDCRPDYSWIIIGPERSGSSFHKDPNYTSAWNTAIRGKKLWVMLPPHIVPPGVGTDSEESEVTSPVGIAEWVISGFFNDAAVMEECLMAVTFPGECMHVPAGWWHSVFNLDDSIAITQNFVPRAKLYETFKFLKHRNTQISGFYPRSVRDAIDKLLVDFPSKDENALKLLQYKDKFDQLNLDMTIQNEDCGELSMSELPEIPIYELFKLLLLKQGETELVSEADKKLTQYENSLTELKSRKTAWSSLVCNNDLGSCKEDPAPVTSSFSFGFNPDSSDEEDD